MLDSIPISYFYFTDASITGAPECYRPPGSDPKTRPYITQKIDIWSLGCIFSEAAVWIMGGRTALTEFRQSRKEEVSEIGIGDHDCFHDGRMALPLIRTYTKNLYSVTRNHLTQTVLDTLLGEMLSSANERPSAEKVHDDLQRMILLENAVQDNKPLPSKSSIGQSMKAHSSVAGSSTSVYKNDTALMNIDPSSQDLAYTWDSVPAHRLPQDSLEMYLIRKFGNLRFSTRVCRFALPRKEQILYKANNGAQSNSSTMIFINSSFPDP